MAGGLTVHHGFELFAGAGLMFQRELGLRVAAAGWASVVPLLARIGWRGAPRWDAVLAFATGANLAAAAVHYTLWPWHLWPSKYCGVPVLTSAEGLAHGHLPVYNAILLGWGGAAIGTSCGIRAGSRVWALLGFVLALPLRRQARHHFEWICQQARIRPAWWNRALAEPGPRP